MMTSVDARDLRPKTRKVVLVTVMSMTLGLMASGCTMTELMPTSSFSAYTPASGRPVEMAVVAEPRMVEQTGQQIQGLVVQVVLLDSKGTSTAGEGGITFSVYAEENARDEKVEPDHQWKFTKEELAQSVTQSASLGTVHNFWLPLKGNIVKAKKLQLLTLHTTSAGLQLAQWNQVLLKAPPTMKIEHYTEGEKKADQETDEVDAPSEETVPVEEASMPRRTTKK